MIIMPYARYVRRCTLFVGRILLDQVVRYYAASRVCLEEILDRLLSATPYRATHLYRFLLLLCWTINLYCQLVALMI
jgi:hypothetical protein